jgi:hypothetical protein
LLLSLCLSKGHIPQHVITFENQILSALSTMYTSCDKEDVPIQLQGMFNGTDDEVCDRVGKSLKMRMAVQQFVNAYYTFDKFEAQYPEISKML